MWSSLNKTKGIQKIINAIKRIWIKKSYYAGRKNIGMGSDKKVKVQEGLKKHLSS